MKTKKMDYMTLSYYDGDELDRPSLPKDSFRSVSGCQWICDRFKIPYQCVCITQWDADDEIVCQMSVREAVDSGLEVLI